MFSGKQAELVFALAQYYAFGASGSASLKALAKHVGLGEQQTRKHLASLEEKGTVKKTRGRAPRLFALSDDFAHEYLSDALIE